MALVVAAAWAVAYLMSQFSAVLGNAGRAGLIGAIASCAAISVPICVARLYEGRPLSAMWHLAMAPLLALVSWLLVGGATFLTVHGLPQGVVLIATLLVYAPIGLVTYRELLRQRQSAQQA